MLPRDSHPPADLSELLDSPTRTYSRREMASDGDITLPHNPMPALSLHAGNPEPWHPDPNALADADVEWAGDEEERAASGTQQLNDVSSHRIEWKRGFAFPRSGSSLPVGSVHVPPISTRPPPPLHDAAVDEAFARPLPPPPRMPGSVPPRAFDDAMREPPYADRRDPDAGSGTLAPLALVPRPSWLARTPQVPVTLERSISVAPPAILDTYGPHRTLVTLRTLWVGMGATVMISAAVAALVSSLVWRLHARADKPDLFAEHPAVATDTGRNSEPSMSAGPSAEPQPKSVSVDQLPLLSGTRTAAPVTIAGSEPPRAEPREEPRPAERAPSAPARWAPKSPPSPAAAVAAPAPSPPPARESLSVEQAIAARMAEETPPKSAEAGASQASPPGPADRDDVARAVAQGAAAAKSCGSSPETGQVMVKFAPSGSAQAVQLLKPFSNRDVNGCVLRAMSRARVRPFSGDSVSVRKTLRW